MLQEREVQTYLKKKDKNLLEIIKDSLVNE